MANESYNLAAVQDLLLAAFTADDLRRLVLYTSRPALKPLVHRFSPDDGLTDMVEKTTTYCHKQDCLADLLDEVKEANPRQYARFEGQVAPDSDVTQSASNRAEPSATAPGGTSYVTYIRDARGLAIGDGARVFMTPEGNDEDETGE